MYSFRIEQAIRAAAILHQQQVRKGSMPLPYVTHLYSVALFLTEHTDNEDVLVAALLHDTIEDTDYTEAELQEDFGGTVTDIVRALSEPKVKADGRKLNWHERKQAYAKQLKYGPPEAILVAAADKIHNFRTTVEEYCTDYNRFFQDFGRSIDDRIEVYQAIANVILDRLPAGTLRNEFEHVYGEYIQFLNDTKHSL